MVYYCPQAIMESIISRSPNHNNSNNHHDAANPNNVPQDNVLVPFPSLHLNNPPTDSSEDGTAASASAGDGATASSSLAASSTDGHQNNGNDGGRQHHPSSSSEEHSTKVTSQPPIIPNLVGTSDPSFRIKTYLNELVAYSKEGGVKHSGGGDEEDCRKKKKRKLDQQPSPSSQQQQQEEPALSSNENHRPIDAIMHWMDSFQDDEAIQVSYNTSLCLSIDRLFISILSTFWCSIPILSLSTYT